MELAKVRTDFVTSHDVKFPRDGEKVRVFYFRVSHPYIHWTWQCRYNASTGAVSGPDGRVMCFIKDAVCWQSLERKGQKLVWIKSAGSPENVVTQFGFDLSDPLFPHFEALYNYVCDILESELRIMPSAEERRSFCHHLLAERSPLNQQERGMPFISLLFTVLHSWEVYYSHTLDHAQVPFQRNWLGSHRNLDILITALCTHGALRTELVASETKWIWQLELKDFGILLLWLSRDCNFLDSSRLYVNLSQILLIECNRTICPLPKEAIKQARDNADHGYDRDNRRFHYRKPTQTMAAIIKSVKFVQP
jgi:hypothetical protein